jgi:amino acid adenylation domain-containing protein
MKVKKPGKKNIRELLALTPMQEGMLFHYLKDPRRNLYFAQLCLEIAGKVDIEIFTAAWNFVVKSNEMLRTFFRWEQVKAPLQIILKESFIQLHYYDFSHKKGSETGSAVEEVKKQEWAKGFDLRDIPFRVALGKIEEDKYFVIISNHHILYDGWSNGIILKEFFEAYNQLSKGKSLQELKPTIKTKFKEFVQWIGTQGEDKDRQMKETAFWENYLAGFAGETGIPVKRRKSLDKKSREESRDYHLGLDPGTCRSLERFSAEFNITAAELFYCVWGLLLQRYNNSDDVLFNTTVSGRSAKVPGIEKMVGLFINTLPLRVCCYPGETGLEMLQSLHNTFQSREDYENTPLVKISQYSRGSYNEGYVDSIVVVENYPLDTQQLQENSPLTIESYSMMEASHYDLTVVIRVFAGIQLHFLYQRGVFAEDVIRRLGAHFLCMIREILENPGRETTEIDILSDREKQQLLEDFNNTTADYPRDKTIPQLFKVQVERTPDNTAVVGPLPVKDRTYVTYMTYITYRELNEKANQLAHILIEKGAAPDTVVGIMTERSVEMIIGIFGILKAGAAYLPIDPDFPEDRINYMLNDSGARFLVTTIGLSGKIEKLSIVNCQLLMVNEELPGSRRLNIPPKEANSVNNYQLTINNLQLKVNNLAYVIYTSGTTGKPKGVAIEHGSLVNRLNWMQKKYPIDSNDTILQKTTFTFDVSVWEILWWSVVDAKVCLLPPGGEKEPGIITRIVERNKVTTMHFVPSMLSVFLDYLKSSGHVKKLSGLKQVIASGEALLPAHVEQFNQLLKKENGTLLANLYGPTEATIDVSYFDCSETREIIPIGKPIDNIRLYILDKQMHIQPVGIPGELGISGIGLARGYLNRPELTAEKFDHDLWDLQDYQDGYHRSYKSYILYKTGDLVRWLPDGNIEFLGRVDHQVKIRGFRIELEEIENCLRRHDGIKEAAVIAGGNEQEEKYLSAYIVPASEVGTDELKEHLSKVLPGYMVPSYFFQVEEIPLTASGKADRRALLAAAASLGTGVEYVAPGDDVEKQIARVWEELLGVDRVGTHDNFFDIGGNSLLIIRSSSRLSKLLKKDIPVVTLFNYPTIASLARYLKGKEKERDTGKVDAGKARIEKSRIIIEREERQKIEIAVIGMAGRFPGAGNIEEFWDNLKNSVESITFFSSEELIECEVDRQLLDNPDYIYVPAKGVSRSTVYFDSSFFGYLPAEAEIMDPQMRIFHECCWEAIEDAGYNTETYDGIIGLYAGASPSIFWEVMPYRAKGNSESPWHSASQVWEGVQYSDSAYMNTRIGYRLNLKGPCITVQTACSTSLVAIVLACRELLSGSCDIALAGGVSVSFEDKAGYLYQEGMIMSPDGHCRAFDANANGMIGGDGAGVVVLKPLTKALADGDYIRAVIKGTALNNDGIDKVGFTAPGVEGQARVIRAAYQAAGVEPGTITYIETHGTGTFLGDPVEIEALKQAFDSNKKNFCAVGSVKSNIGHLDAAAGVAGFIKTVLALENHLIPPSLHFETPNPKIGFDNSPFFVNHTLKEWKTNGYPLRAGVSSFGIGGTNAHVILEEAPQDSKSVGQWASGSVSQGVNGQRTYGRGGSLCPPSKSREYQLILLSAKTPSALDKMTENLTKYFKKNLLNRDNHEYPTNPVPTLADAAYTLQIGRKAFPCRRMLVCPANNVGEAVRALDAGSLETRVTKKDKPTIIFMFSGQGSQFVNMGLDLYKTEPVFRDQVDYCFECLEKITGVDMKPVLYPDLYTLPLASPGHPLRGTYSSQEGSEAAEAEEKILQFFYTTPIKFIFEYSLAVLLMKWGIRPHAMIGHSFGEYAAACLSGVFSLEDALFMAALRGELMHGLPEGAMLSVPLAEKQLKPLLNDEISLAAVNGESMCVVSGPVEAMAAFEKELNEKGCECLRYHVPKAGHSWMVEPILEEFKEKIRRVKLNKPGIPYISGLTGQWITTEEAVDPGYWTRHLREPVRFANGLTTLFKEPEPIFLQVGPGRGLTLFVSQHPDKKPGTPIFNMVRHRKEKISDVYYTLNKIGQLWLQGVSIDGKSFYASQKRFRVPLPTYPFEHKYYPPPKDLLKLDAGRSPTKSLLTHKADMTDWFYIPVWEQSPLTLTSFSTTRSREAPGFFTWLVFMDDMGLGTRLVKALPKTAREVVIVKIGDEYTGESENSYILNPGQANDYDRLFQELRQSGRLPDRIIHLWSVTDYQKTGQGLKELDGIQDLGFYSLFYMVQALGRQDISREIQVKVVTNNMQSVTGEEDTCPGKATIRGAVKIIPLEYVNIKCTSIDILLSAPGPGSQIEDRLIPQLLNELLVDHDNNIIALRGNRRWCETMKPCPLEKQDPVAERLAEKGVYLITGGFGGMGFTFARHLANDFKAKLILVGRSFFPARQDWTRWLADHPEEDKVSVKIRQIQEWEEGGAEIMVGSADVSNLEQMRAVISEAHQRFGPINGVLHTAGKGDYAGMIQQRTREITEQVMAPKVRGTLVLDEVLKDDRLDFLVLFSSIGNIIYQVKFAQVGYNAANEFLEAFAYYKTRKDGTYTVTINWNDWLEVGMSIEATDRKYQKHWKYKSMAGPGEIDYESAIHAGIKPDQGVEVFRRILGRPLERVTVSMVDLDEMVRVLKGLKNKDSSTIEAVEEQAVSMEAAPRPPLRTPYLPPVNPEEEALCEIWSNYFGIESVGTADDFFELGGDSLKAMIINQKIHHELEIRIPLADFFNNPTIKGQAEYIQLKGSQRSQAEKRIYSSITPAEKKEYYLLSSAQQRIYSLHHMDEKSTGYNITHIVLLEGEIDTKRLQGIFSRLTRRHESLRTSFHIVGDQPRQKVHPEVPFEIENYEVKVEVEVEEEEQTTDDRGQTTGDRRQKIDGKSATHLSSVIRHLSSGFIRPFDLSDAPLLRVGMVKFSGARYILLMDTHHIISDGTSVDVLTKEFTGLYQGDALAGLRLQYKDYLEWRHRQEREKPGLEKIKKQEAFWLKQLAGELPVLSLPLDYPRPLVQSFEGSSQVFEIGPRETKRLKTLALQEGTTLFTVLLALCNTWLARLSGQEEIILGSVTAGRDFEELQPVIGMFVNTFALRNFPIGTKTFKQFLGEVKARTLAAFENQDYPFKDLVEKTALKSDTSRNPLFDVMFILQHMDSTHLQIPGLTIKPCPVNTGIAKFDLSLEGEEQENKLLFTVEYCTKLFKAETIERLINCFSWIVSLVVGQPDIRLCEIEIISEEEKRRVLHDFNDTRRKYPADKTIQQLFAGQVERTPGNIALAAALPMKNRTHMTYITYRELNEKSQHLAHFLKEKAVKADTVVGIMVERSIEMIIGLLGILKAGGAYLPIDPGYPRDRIDFILKDSNARIILKKSEIRNPKSETNPNDSNSNYQNKRAEVTVLNFEHLNFEFVSNFEFRASDLKSSNLAYIIYTSGSTGKPKGVLVEHKNVLRLVKNSNYIHGEKGDKLLPTGSVIFDISTFEIWWPLLNGLTLVLADENTILDAGQLEETLVKNNVTILHLVPQLFNQMAAQHPQLFGHIKYFLVGGDVVSPEYINRVRNRYPGLKILHMYGPTENTTFSTFFPVERQFEGGIPIGKPISNTTVYILDRYTWLQPIGAAGELCVGGKGLARGYLNQPELTAEKFDHDLWDLQDYQDKKKEVKEVPGKNNYMSYRSHRSYIYHTGDLAKWLPDGSIEFLGRIDRQVKIRGFRIELGEIENRLLKHDQVNEAAVVMKSRCLCAYVVLSGSSASLSQTPRVPLISRELKKYLAQFLPGYMIPTYFIQLQAMPLTPNGKIDRKALPEPVIDAGEHYTAPGNEIERKLLEIWSGILGRKTGIHDNFFEIGGHSLNAAVLVSKIYKEFNVKLSLTEFFRTPFIRETAEYIKRTAGEEYIRPEPVEKREYYPLSSNQQRLYILQQMETEGIAYNMPTVVSLEGQLDRERLEETFRQLIRRHESFRTSFHMIDNEPMQRTHNEVEFEIKYYDLPVTGAGDECRWKGVPFRQISNAFGEITPPETGPHHSSFIIHHSFIRPFDLSREPLLRAGLVKTGENQYTLVLDMHHIISDGTSMGILVREFMDLYAGKNPPALQTRYKDYSQWQQLEKQQSALKKQKDYWLKQLNGELPVLTLPTDYPRPPVQSFAGRTITFALHKTVSVRLKELARQADVTLFMILLAVFNVFLSKISGQEDILVGIPVSARKHEDWQHIIGMFVNTLVSRNQPTGEKTFIDFLDQLKTQVLTDFENQEYPFEDLVENLEIKRDTGGNPIFDVMFAFQNIDIPTLEIPGLKLEPYDFDMGVSKFDLLLETLEKEEVIYFNLQYCVSLFKHEAIERFIVYFKNLIRGVIENHKRRISQFEILTEAERRWILFDVNDTGKDYPLDKTLQRLFAEQAERTPGSAAAAGPLSVQDRTCLADMTYISYRELNEKSDRLAYLLQKKGVEHDTIVGIMIERSLEMVIGILGVLKAGGAYMPIDPEYPEERKQYMLKDSGAKILLTEQEIAGVSSPEAFNFNPKGTTSHLHLSLEPASSLAYVIYTSGSTGSPKGVMVEHGNVIRLVKNPNYVELNEETRILQTGAPVFDATTLEIWGSLLNGGRLVIVKNDVILDGHRLGKALIKNHINTLWLSSPLFNQLMQRHSDIFSFPGLKYLLVGGDVLLPRYINEVRNKNKKLNVINGYGPTENTTFSTCYAIKDDFQRSVPIGRPISNSTAYILDEHFHLQPVGVWGELYVGGKGVSRGYLNNPVLTNERFIKNPLSKRHRLYRTGDVTRWLWDGNIEFLGRKDHQVKIRGYRVESGEIKACLLKHPLVKEAVIIVQQQGEPYKTGESEEKYLCAYVVAAGHEVSAQLKEYLSLRLPAFMVPAYIVPLVKIPLNPNGKVDRKALPGPGTGNTGEDYTPPRDEVEEKLVEIWSRVLGLGKNKISIDADFFALGGHSLKATVLTADIHKAFQVQLPLEHVFQHPFVKDIAHFIKSAARVPYTRIKPGEEKEYYPLSSAQQQIYLRQQVDLQSIGYNTPRVMILEGDLEKRRMEKVIRQLIHRHESLRTSYLLMDGEPMQKVHDHVQFEIEYYDKREVEVEQEKAPFGQISDACGGHSPESRELRDKSFISSFIRPFDLSRVPLMRVGLFKTGGQEHILIADMHHIITDAVSSELFIEEFILLYIGRTLPPLKIQYKDFVQWQVLQEAAGLFEKQRTYWLEQFQGKIPVLDLQPGKNVLRVKDFKGKRITSAVDEKETRAVKALAKQENATLFMILLAVFCIHLSKISGQEDIVIGSPIAGRRHKDLQPIMGRFVNMLSLRNFPREEKDFIQFLKEVRKRTLAAYENQDFQYEDLVKQVVQIRDPWRNPLFDVVLALQNVEPAKQEIPGLRLKPYPFEHKVSRFDLTLIAAEENGKLVFFLEYSSWLFKQPAAERLLRGYFGILKQIIANPYIRVKNITLDHDLLEAQAIPSRELQEDFGF